MNKPIPKLRKAPQPPLSHLGATADSDRAKRPPLAAISRSGRNDLGGKQTWGPEHKEMAAVSKKRSVTKSFDGYQLEADLDRVRGKADHVEEETGIVHSAKPPRQGPRHLVPRGRAFLIFSAVGDLKSFSL